MPRRFSLGILTVRCRRNQARSRPSERSTDATGELALAGSEREILTVDFVDLPSHEAVSEAMARVAGQEAVCHERIEEVIESTSLRAIYEQLDESDFSTDESVAAGRP